MAVPTISPPQLAQRKTLVLLLLTGLFLSTIVVANLLGLTRFLNLGFFWGDRVIPFSVPLGVLLYPITFLCIDLITEFYGRKQAATIVWIGFFTYLWTLALLWLAQMLPWQAPLAPASIAPDATHPDYLFFQIKHYAQASLCGSIAAYLLGQLVDVAVFDRLKKATRGKHLWLRNNLSKLLSQLIDTAVVISLAYAFTGVVPQALSAYESPLLILIVSSYFFKIGIALVQTLPLYLIVYAIRRYLCLFDQLTFSKNVL